MAKLNTDLPLMIGYYAMNKLESEITAIEDENVDVTWNSYGGSVWAGYQFADFLQTTDKNVTARVTGIAASMGTALLPYFKKVVGSVQSDVMIHSVSTDIKSIKARKNTELYDLLKAKINEPKFKDITGVELKAVLMAEDEDRKDIWLSGQQAFDVGLFDELIDLTPDELQTNALLTNDFKLSAELGYNLPEHLSNKAGETKEGKVNNTNTNINSNNNFMDVNKLKAEHPAVYAEVFEAGTVEGNTQGATAEKNRVDSWMVFNDVEPDKVKAGIESGKEMTKAEMMNFMRASQKAEMQNGLESSSAEDLTPDNKVGAVLTGDKKEEEAEAAAYADSMLPKVEEA